MSSRLPRSQPVALDVASRVSPATLMYGHASSVSPIDTLRQRVRQARRSANSLLQARCRRVDVIHCLVPTSISSTARCTYACNKQWNNRREDGARHRRATATLSTAPTLLPYQHAACGAAFWHWWRHRTKLVARRSASSSRASLLTRLAVFIGILLVAIVCFYDLLHVVGQVALIGSLPAYDVTTHLGTPENSPPPGIEFLGSGYDLVYGNPLDEQGEAFLDPGFRLPAIELLFDVRRTAGGYQEPLGTSLKRGPACKYATLAQEVATVSAYQQLLALDVTTVNEFGIAQPINNNGEMSSPSSSSTGAAGPLGGDPDGFNVIPNPIPGVGFGTSYSTFATSATGSNGSNGPSLQGGSSYNYGSFSSSSTGRAPDKVGGPQPQSSVLGTAFVGSFGFADARQNLEQKDQIAFYSRSLCVEYQVEFRSFIPPLLTENFSNGIAFLPDFVPNEADLSDRAADARTRFRAFIAEFGTHYIHRLVAGGKRIVTTLLSASAVASLREKDVNIALGAAFMPSMLSENGTVPTAFANTNFTIASQQSNFESMSSQIESRIETTIGGLPFINFYGWAVTVPERTTPVQYTLKPLYALLPNGPKRTALKMVLTAYLNSAGKYPSVDNRSTFLNGAGSLTQDAPPPSMVYNNAPRAPSTTTPSTLVPPVPTQGPPATPAVPSTIPSPIDPQRIPNRLPSAAS